MLFRSRLRRLESESHNALDAYAGEYGDFGCDFPGLVPVRTPALPGVFAFAIFADENPVDAFGWVDSGEWGLDAGKGANGANIGVELHRTADGEEEAPEGDVVGDI